MDELRIIEFFVPEVMAVDLTTRASLDGRSQTEVIREALHAYLYAVPNNQPEGDPNEQQ